MTNLCDSQIELEQTLWEKSQPPHNAYGRLQPQLLQANFHGFNLVGYNGKVYGLSLALGPVDLTRTTREQIERWQESGLCIVRSGASNSGPATNGAPTNTSEDPSSSLRFSRHKCLAYDDGERDRAILRRIAEAMLSQGGNVAVAGTARLTRYLLKLCPEVKEKLACVLAEDEASAPDFQGLPVVKITAVPSEVRSVFIASAEHRDIERLTSFLPRRVAVYTLESILELDKSLVPPAAWVKRVAHLYPINIPEIEVQEGLDFLLVDLPARSIAQMPAGLAYVHNAVKKCGFRFQTLDCDIIMYHRFHSHRLLDGVEEVRTTSGYLLPDDPWQPEHYLRWESDEFLDYFRTELEEIIRKIVAAKPRIIGLSLQQANLKVSRMVIEGVKKAAPETTVIVGGMSCLQPEAAKRIMPAADYVVVGEADLVIGPLLGDVLAGRKPQNIPGVWAKNDAEGRLFSPGPMVMDLNELEPPRYDWTDIQLYRNWNGYQLTPVVGSRGCRWARCTFCAERFKWRSRSAENIVNELQWLCSRGFTNIVFNESDFHGDPQLIARMCREIVRLGLKLSITAQLRCHKSVDADYFRLLYSAGVRCLRFGVDGGSANVLKLEKKGYTKDMIRRNLRDAASAGIFTEVNLVVGVPGETEEDVEETIEFLKELQPHIGRLAFINPLMLFRGSDYWDYPEKFHICLHSDREELLRNYPVAIPDKEWHSENPFIDHQVRYARVNRIVRALRKNGMPLGDYALRTADRLEEAEKAQETMDNPALAGAPAEKDVLCGGHAVISFPQTKVLFRRTQRGNLHYGLPDSLGPVNLDNPAERNLPQILTSRTSEGLEQAIVRASRPKAAPAPPTLLERGVGAFNLFQVDSVYVAVPSEVTSLNVNQLREGTYGKFLASESLDKLRQRIANTPEHPTIRTNRPLIIGSGSPDWTRQIVAALKCKTAVSLVTDERTAPAEWPHIVADPTSRDSLAAQLRMAAFDLVVVCYGPHLGTVPWESLVAPNCRRLLAVFPSGSARLYEDNHFTRILYNMAYLRSMYRALPSLHGARVIELGCSDGLTCELVTHEGASSVVGVDSLETVGLLYQNPRCAFLKEDATNLPFSDGSFDVAYSIATLEHVSQPLAMLSEMRRLLRPGGYGYVQTAPFYYAPFGHHMFGYFDEMPWIHVRLSKTEIAEYARTTGVAQRIEKEQGCSVEEYVESMINLEHVNGLLPHEYRVEDFAKANDIEVLRFATSREGENLLDSAIIEQVRPVRPHHLTTHGFELVFKKIGQAH